MKNARIILLIFSLMSPGAGRAAAKNTLNELRNGLFEIMKSEDQTRYYILQLEPCMDPVSRAYYGALNACMARHVFFPVKKWKYFVQGKEQLERAVKEAPVSVEIRFLRLVIQSKAPSWLGYTSDIRKDLNFILARIKMNKPEERILLETIAKNMLELEPLGSLGNTALKTRLTNLSIQ